MATIAPLALRAPLHLAPPSGNPRFHAIYKRPDANVSFHRKPLSSLSVRNPKVNNFTAYASSSSGIGPQSTKSEARSSLLTGSTRSVSSLAVLSVVVIRALAQKLSFAIQNPNPLFVDAVRFSLRTVGPAFFASLRDRPAGYLNTPLTVVAAGLKKWLDIYSGVLMVRVLLSWFPNIPWERQPLSAIRDLCDPYLNLFRNIIPPVFDTLDVSPLLAFAVLGTLGSIVNSSTGLY